MSLELWKRIQLAVGATADGIPGPGTARKVAEALKVQPPLAPQAADLASPIRELVTGEGRDIRRIAIHCTATREGQDISVATIKQWHLKQGWKDIGYHFVIALDGTVERGRPESIVGSHVAGFNTGSIGLVYVGGLDAQGKAKDTRTPAQKLSMAELVRALLAKYPGSDVLGHRDHSPDKDGDGVIEPQEWLKECPCFDVRAWWGSVK
jgi:N-acetylmuramoyl-L-alanine amidase